MEAQPLSPTLTVERLFAQWPQTISVFLRHRYGCIGCLMAPFDTVHDVARNYQVDVAELLAELIEGESKIQSTTTGSVVRTQRRSNNLLNKGNIAIYFFWSGIVHEEQINHSS